MTESDEPSYNGVVKTSMPAPAVETAHHVVGAASDKQAADIVMLDLRGVADFADFFVIMTAESPRQIDALAVDIESALEQEGVRLHHREGATKSGWVLLDFSDVIVHIFLPESRDFYKIEEAWSSATETVRIQ